MPLPTVTNNSPVAGAISWGGFNISWNGQSANIGAGNTTAKYVWYKHNAGSTPTLVAGSSLPDDLLPEDLLIFVNRNGIGTLAPFQAKVNGDLIVPGTVLSEAISTNAITSNHIASNVITSNHIGANVITSTHIGANVITADMIAAGAIQADKLSVGTVSDNMVVNGSFEDFDPSGRLIGWEISAMTNGTIALTAGVTSSGKYAMQFSPTTTAGNLRLRQRADQYIPVSSASGRRMYVSARMGVGGGVNTTSGSYLRVNWYDANKVFISSSDLRTNGAMTTTFTIYEGQATPPATARYMGVEVLWVNFNIVANLYLDEVTVHEVTMAAQIGDGQISAAKIVSNTITGNQIAANSIYTDKLQIAEWTNWFSNPGFNQGSTFLDNWAAGSGVAVADANFISGRALQNTVLGNYASRYQLKNYDVRPGEKFYLSATVQNSTGAIAPSVRVLIKDAAGTNVLNGGTATTTTNGAYVQDRYTVVTVPATGKLMQLWVEMHNPTGGTQTIGDLICRRMERGELIVDGAITANHISVNAITANHIGANVITAEEIGVNVITGKHIGANVIVSEMILANAIGAEEIAANAIYGTHIMANQISTGHLQANSITSDLILANAVGAAQIAADAIYGEHLIGNAIDGMTITGATVQTATSGARVQMDSTGLKAWNAAGTQYLTADSTGLTMEALVKVKGLTDFGTTANAMTAYVGNISYGSAKKPDGTYYDNSAGLHWKVDANNPEQEHARVVSKNSTDVYIGSGKKSNIANGIEGSIEVEQDRIRLRTTNNTVYRGYITANATMSGGPNVELRVGGNSGAYADRIDLDAPDTYVSGNLYIGGTKVGGQVLGVPLSPSGYSVTGDLWSENFAGGTRVTMALTPKYTSTGLAITTTGYTALGVMIPVAFRSATATAAYFPVQIVGGGLNTAAICYVAPASGTISLRAISANFTLANGALFTFNYAYQV